MGYCEVLCILMVLEGQLTLPKDLFLSLLINIQEELQDVRVPVSALELVTRALLQCQLALCWNLPRTPTTEGVVGPQHIWVVSVSEQNARHCVCGCRHHLHQKTILPVFQQDGCTDGKLHIAIPVIFVFLLSGHLGAEPQDSEVSTRVVRWQAAGVHAAESNDVLGGNPPAGAHIQGIVQVDCAGDVGEGLVGVWSLTHVPSTPGQPQNVITGLAVVLAVTFLEQSVIPRRSGGSLQDKW